MPNHIANRITFAADRAADVFAVVVRNDHFDFETLVPPPLNMYRGDLSSTDEKDFPTNWLSWSRGNWGTKWNAYETSHGVEGNLAFINFQTAWNPPYPVMAAFCNRFNIPFEHRYFDEGENFWGIDVWGLGEFGSKKEFVSRIEKHYKREEDRRSLALLYWSEETLVQIEKERAENA